MLEILAKHRGAISIAELSEMTKFRTDDIVKTLQAFNLIRYFGGQHSIFVSPKTLEMYYSKAKPNWVIDSSKMPTWYAPYSGGGTCHIREVIDSSKMPTWWLPPHERME